ncbi:MAG: nucleotidyltransferase family protein, partial [Lachnospiraceae bacterium]
MKIAGIVTEYNPFHNGHAYQIKKARQLTGCDGICVVLSGNFCQRGIPAVTDKYSRSAMALSNGVDLIFELPVCNALSSAQNFAK